MSEKYLSHSKASLKGSEKEQEEKIFSLQNQSFKNSSFQYEVADEAKQQAGSVVVNLNKDLIE